MWKRNHTLRNRGLRRFVQSLCCVNRGGGIEMGRAAVQIFPLRRLHYPIYPFAHPQLLKKRTIARRRHCRRRHRLGVNFCDCVTECECHVRAEGRTRALFLLLQGVREGGKGGIGFSPGYYSLHALDLLGTTLQGEHDLVWNLLNQVNRRHGV